MSFEFVVVLVVLVLGGLWLKQEDKSGGNSRGTNGEDVAVLDGWKEGVRRLEAMPVSTDDRWSRAMRADIGGRDVEARLEISHRFDPEERRNVPINSVSLNVRVRPAGWPGMTVEPTDPARRLNRDSDGDGQWLDDGEFRIAVQSNWGVEQASVIGETRRKLHRLGSSEKQWRLNGGELVYRIYEPDPPATRRQQADWVVQQVDHLLEVATALNKEGVRLTFVELPDGLSADVRLRYRDGRSSQVSIDFELGDRQNTDIDVIDRNSIDSVETLNSITTGHDRFDEAFVVVTDPEKTSNCRESFNSQLQPPLLELTDRFEQVRLTGSRLHVTDRRPGSIESTDEFLEVAGGPALELKSVLAEDSPTA